MACVSGTTFTVGGVSATTGSLTCKNTITGDYQNTGRSCGHDGTLINLGFNTGATHGFTTYIESCYSMVTGSLRYTRHIIPGQAIARKWFKWLPDRDKAGFGQSVSMRMARS